MKWHKTIYPGVRYREHPKRKYAGKPDKYFVIRYRLEGQQRDEALGWATQGWNAVQASQVLAELKKNQMIGEGPRTLAEKRRLSREKDEAEKVRREQEVRDQITFAGIFEKHYFPQAQADKKPQSYGRESSLFHKWIRPIMGDFPLKDIGVVQLQKLKKEMLDAGRSPRSVEYAMAVIRQVFNFSRNTGLFGGEHPIGKIRLPKVDNRRIRFLTKKDADQLLEALKAQDPETWEQALISLHCGLRASEIFGLAYADVDLQGRMLLVKDAKGGTRIAHMTREVEELFLGKKFGRPDALVYPGPDGKMRRVVSRVFERVVKELGLNDGISDRRQRIVFHSLRHTYASWMLQSGEDIYTVRKMLGQKTLSMAARYSHVSDTALKDAVRAFETFLREPESKLDKADSKVLPLREK